MLSRIPGPAAVPPVGIPKKPRIHVWARAPIIMTPFNQSRARFFDQLLAL